ncbi:MAG: hypothetical protein AAB332_05850 [Planctomycetota bacterium]
MKDTNPFSEDKQMGFKAISRTEAIPLPVTAMLGACLCILLGVADARVVFAPFADPIIFLFIGGFIIARAMTLHHLVWILLYPHVNLSLQNIPLRAPSLFCYYLPTLHSILHFTMKGALGGAFYNDYQVCKPEP